MFGLKHSLLARDAFELEALRYYLQPLCLCRTIHLDVLEVLQLGSFDVGQRVQAENTFTRKMCPGLDCST